MKRTALKGGEESRTEFTNEVPVRLHTSFFVVGLTIETGQRKREKLNNPTTPGSGLLNGDGPPSIVDSGTNVIDPPSTTEIQSENTPLEFSEVSCPPTGPALSYVPTVEYNQGSGLTSGDTFEFDIERPQDNSFQFETGSSDVSWASHIAPCPTPHQQVIQPEMAAPQVDPPLPHAYTSFLRCEIIH
jgi:hypothetical protein